MGKYTRLTSIAVGGLLVDYGLLAYIVRNDEIVDVSAHDPIFKSAAYQKFNPNRNVATQDEVIKRIPLSALKPEVLEQKERIADKFAGGVFGGTAYAIQRYIMTKKYFNESTKNHLWDKEEIKKSSFPVGTIITDHFEVVDKSRPIPQCPYSQVTVRCGDSPSKRDVRESDGLFQISALVDEEKQELVLGLKSVFYQGLGKSEGEPMPWHIKKLHQAYALALLENGSRELTTSRLL